MIDIVLLLRMRHRTVVLVGSISRHGSSASNWVVYIRVINDRTTVALVRVLMTVLLLAVVRRRHRIQRWRDRGNERGACSPPMVYIGSDTASNTETIQSRLSGKITNEGRVAENQRKKHASLLHDIY